MRIYRAALTRFLGDRTSWLDDERALLTGQTNAVDLIYLASGYAHLGEFDAAMEIVGENLRQGRVHEGEFFYRVLAPELVASPAFQRFQEEHVALQQRLLQQYGPDSF